MPIRGVVLRRGERSGRLQVQPSGSLSCGQLVGANLSMAVISRRTRARRQIAAVSVAIVV